MSTGKFSKEVCWKRERRALDKCAGTILHFDQIFQLRKIRWGNHDLGLP